LNAKRQTPSPEAEGTPFGVGPAEVRGLVSELAQPRELAEVPSFRIGAFNLYNLFGQKKDSTNRRSGPPPSKERLQALGAMILEMDADAIAFEEVQDERVLSDLFRDYVNGKLDDRQKFKSFVVIPARDPRGINVALATRLAVVGAMTFHDREFGPIRKRPTRFSRDLLGVDLYATPTYRFLFFVAHLKSMIGGRSAAAKRRLEAKEIRTILEKPAFGSSRGFIQQDMLLAGDMNDDPKSTVARILEGSGATSLRDVLSEVDPNYTYPTHNRRKKVRLDFILASPSIRVNTPRIHQTNPVAPVASDHFAVSATVAVPRR
jgi:endonuclease/exonuclease/phosphatase family metal-dependent hydrolase